MVICSAIFAKPSSVLAVPTLPSSFYGTVKLNHANVTDGTVVQAFIGAQMIAQGYTQAYQDDSVYSLDIPADNPDTLLIDGGREGDTINFKVAGILANETGAWHSATAVQLNLTVSSASTTMTPLATPTELPTQTPITATQRASSTPTLSPIVVAQSATSTPTPALLASTTAIIPSLDTNTPDLPTSTSEQPAQPPPVPGEKVPGSAKDPGTTIPIMAFVLIVIIGAGFVALLRRNK